jgi:hypothetical protein
MFITVEEEAFLAAFKDACVMAGERLWQPGLRRLLSVWLPAAPALSVARLLRHPWLLRSSLLLLRHLSLLLLLLFFLLILHLPAPPAPAYPGCCDYLGGHCHGVGTPPGRCLCGSACLSN